MKTKVNKIAKTIAVGIFFMALFFNVKVSLEDPFFELDNMAIAQTSSSGSGIYYTEFDYCQLYYSNCTKRVIKCRETGNRFCEAAIQLPCAEACGY
jgi:hypothetical protein